MANGIIQVPPLPAIRPMYDPTQAQDFLRTWLGTWEALQKLGLTREIERGYLDLERRKLEQDIDQEKFDRALKRWNVLQTLIGSNPSLAQQPGVKSVIRGIFKDIGVDLPEDFDLQGTQKVVDVAKIIDDNWDIFMALPPGEPRRAWLLAHGIKEIPKELETLINLEPKKEPPPPSPRERLQAVETLRRILSDPKTSPEQKLASIEALRRMGFDVGPLADAAAKEVSDWARAQLKLLENRSDREAIQAKKALQDLLRAPTVEALLRARIALTRAQESLTRAREQGTRAQTGLTEERTKLVRAQTEKILRNITSSIESGHERANLARERLVASVQNARNKSLLEQRRIYGNEAARLDKEIDDLMKLLHNVDTWINKAIASLPPGKERDTILARLRERRQSLVNRIVELRRYRDRLREAAARIDDILRSSVGAREPSAPTSAPRSTVPPYDPKKYRGRWVKNNRTGECFYSDGTAWRKAPCPRE